jgi:hypothetical protein
VTPAAKPPKVQGSGPALPRGYWSEQQVREVLDRTLVSHVGADISSLGPGERAALLSLLAAGRVLQDLGEHQEHPQALTSRERLRGLHERLGRRARTADLLGLYELYQGPIATTIENALVPFLPVDPFAEGRNVYPWAIEAAEIQAFLDRRLDLRASILDPRAVVRRTVPAALKADLATLKRQAALAALHPGLGPRLEALLARPDDEPFYAVPYSVAWPGHLIAASEHLRQAADAVDDEDPDFAAFLRHRSRDLLVDDNEAGDAAWVRGSFGHLDAVIGAYESYDDDLFGVKTFFGAAILIRDEAGSRTVRDRLSHLQAVEDALPSTTHRTVRMDIPIGSFDLVAAFAQARGVVAEILPNDPELTRKYGRKIVLRRNLSIDVERFKRIRTRWDVAFGSNHAGELTPEGAYDQVIGHELGHYLGPDTDLQGRTIETALGEDAALIEELKAELVSMFMALRMHRAGQMDEMGLRRIMAGGIVATLRPVRPLRTQPYPTLWQMQNTWFFEHGLLEADGDRMTIRYDRAGDVVEAMLREALALQERGTRAESNAFIERWSAWTDRNQRLATAIRAADPYRFGLDRYSILDEPGDTLAG